MSKLDENICITLDRKMRHGHYGEDHVTKNGTGS